MITPFTKSYTLVRNISYHTKILVLTDMYHNDSLSLAPAYRRANRTDIPGNTISLINSFIINELAIIPLDDDSNRFSEKRITELLITTEKAEEYIDIIWNSSKQS